MWVSLALSLDLVFAECMCKFGFVGYGLMLYGVAYLCIPYHAQPEFPWTGNGSCVLISPGQMFVIIVSAHDVGYKQESLHGKQ